LCGVTSPSADKEVTDETFGVLLDPAQSVPCIKKASTKSRYFLCCSLYFGYFGFQQLTLLSDLKLNPSLQPQEAPLALYGFLPV
jgi:hypothetical protein